MKLMCRSNYDFHPALSLLNTIIRQLTPLSLSQSTATLRESRSSILQTLPPNKQGFSCGEYEEEEEEEEEVEEEEEEEYEEEEEENEEEVKTGKVESSVWWFVEYVRCSLCMFASE